MMPPTDKTVCEALAAYEMLRRLGFSCDEISIQPVDTGTATRLSVYIALPGRKAAGFFVGDADDATTARLHDSLAWYNDPNNASWVVANFERADCRRRAVPIILGLIAAGARPPACDWMRQFGAHEVN